MRYNGVEVTFSVRYSIAARFDPETKTGIMAALFLEKSFYPSILSNIRSTDTHSVPKTRVCRDMIVLYILRVS